MTDPLEQIAEVFSIQKTEAFGYWVELVVKISIARRSGSEGAIAGKCLRSVAKVHGLYFLNLDSRMKAAIKPLIEAEEDALHYVGLHPKKRTACGLAESAAELFSAYLDSLREPDVQGS